MLKTPPRGVPTQALSYCPPLFNIMVTESWKAPNTKAHSFPCFLCQEVRLPYTSVTDSTISWTYLSWSVYNMLSIVWAYSFFFYAYTHRKWMMKQIFLFPMGWFCLWRIVKAVAFTAASVPPIPLCMGHPGQLQRTLRAFCTLLPPRPPLCDLASSLLMDLL